MKYKALMLDLDGTTVPFFSDVVSPQVKKKIHEAHAFVTVSIVTGRLLHQVGPIMDQLDITGPCVINNGSQLYDPVQKKVTYQLNIPKERIEDITIALQAITPNFVISDGLGKEYPASEWSTIDPIVSIYIPPGQSKEVIAAIAETMQKFPDITTNRMTGNAQGDECIEVVNAKGTKQYGIYEVAKMLKIDTHEIIGVGDSYNDFPLLMACGLKIAMGNAVQELKNVADFIAPSVQDDGVATIIDKFILGN